MIPDPHARNVTLLGIGLMLASVFAFSLNNVLEPGKQALPVEPP